MKSTSCSKAKHAKHRGESNVASTTVDSLEGDKIDSIAKKKSNISENELLFSNLFLQAVAGAFHCTLERWAWRWWWVASFSNSSDPMLFGLDTKLLWYKHTSLGTNTSLLQDSPSLF
uniref:AlNc14C531G12069 protein n=1 Tax=Albugo laibachii Nc14 TaxID=890382 RepID=F0X0X9_9STRA|nr:AlNc14C531G12069 [Albugo laibachii Nc14]|eukprot:CCA27425.1 AlNc14C531G12069 [Albugo laibachii Nc14]